MSPLEKIPTLEQMLPSRREGLCKSGCCRAIGGEQLVALLAAIASLLACPQTAHAGDMQGQGREMPENSALRATPVQRQAPLMPECTCRAAGRNHNLGSQICIQGANGNQLFRCVMDLNVTSWKAVGEPCPLS
jgi:hypothetical protein